MLPRTASMRAAYGRAASAAACARRNFDAATICMALVIFCVALVAAIRLRRSLSEAMVQRTTLRSGERPGVIVDDGLELACGPVVEVPRIADRVENVGVLVAQQPQQALLEGAH